MKKILISSLFLFSVIWGFAQPGLNVEMEKNYGDKKFEEAKAVISMSKGGFAIAGYTRSYGGGRADFWVVRTDQQGALTWQQTIGLAEDDEATDLCETKDGGVVAIGNTQSIGKGKKDILIAKYDALGNKVWEKLMGDKGDDWGTKIKCLPTGDIIAIANVTGANQLDGKLIKLSAEGTVIWEKMFGSKGNDYFYGLDIFKDGSIAICGTTTAEKGNETNYWLLKLDSDGNVLWEQKPGTKVMNEQFTDVSISYEGEIFAIGQTLKLDVGSVILNNYTIAKFDAAGVQKYFGNYEQTLDFTANAVLATPDGKAVLTTRTSKKEMQLVKIADLAEIEWTKPLSVSDKDLVYNISLSNTGGYLLAGSIESKGFGGKDFWFMNFKDLYASLAFDIQKKKEKIIVLNGVSTLLIDSSYSTFKDISFDYKVDGLNIYAEVTKAVNQRLAQWEVQTKYEQIKDYYDRLTLFNARAKDIEQTQESLQKFAPERITLYGWKLSDDYTADNQTVTIISSNKFAMKLFVPIERAKTGELDSYWSTYTVGNVKYAFLGQDPVIYSADIIVNGQIYPYEAAKTAPYANQLMLSINKYDESALQMALFYSEAVKYVQNRMDLELKQKEFETPEAYQLRLTP
ncbi:MAG TPA: hypothetical protein DCQ31_09495, partial [Bacteroidales bacterium]|nr:hypothetical protein [Bacteroidales bacterium]